MEAELEGRADARSDEPKARSAARWRVRAADGPPAGDVGCGSVGAEGLVVRWPALAACAHAAAWLTIQTDLGRSARTIDAYARALVDYLGFCERVGVEPLGVGQAEIAGYVRDLRERPGWRGANVVAIDSGGGLSNATVRLRLTAVRLFYDHLVEEGVRDRNPVRRGRYAVGRGRGERGLIPVFNTRLPWIPTDEQWRALLAAAVEESLRNRLMIALAYDAGLRREELCLLASDDVDPAHRTLRVRAETTKTRRGRVVPYSAAGALLHGYPVQHAVRSRASAARCWCRSRGATGVGRSPRAHGRRSCAR